MYNASVVKKLHRDTKHSTFLEKNPASKTLYYNVGFVCCSEVVGLVSEYLARVDIDAAVF
jgi:hypothetical protein